MPFFFVSSAAWIINHYAVLVNIVSPIFKLLNKNTHILIILLHIVKLHIFDRSNYRVRYFHLSIMWLKPCRVNYLKIRKQDFYSLVILCGRKTYLLLLKRTLRDKDQTIRNENESNRRKKCKPPFTLLDKA